MSVPFRVLTALAPGFPAAKAVLNQPGQINVKQWELVEERTGNPEVTWALSVLPNPVTRSNIIGLRHANPDIRRHRVAIASLMWGYGISGARWGAQWVSDVSNFLGPGLDAVLATYEANLITGAIVEAYQLFTLPGPRDIELERYRGIGSSFFTKILYFLARNALQDSSAEYPLILDTKVSMALSRLTGYRLLVRPESYRPRPDSSAYVQYVKTMHAWAAKLNVLPEVIEYYLWAEAAKSGSPLWPTCAKDSTLWTSREKGFPGADIDEQ
jgi:hypothetical protein